ncbi:MurR/RpiR family transcriptional regulator [Deinococcus hopiensis]|uniref:Transcriptional regulator, RpiR family n=1 Tax=Deinococcus hopiensis KR-140 TaxID=695939 RepID=A0A1W1UUB3_9DEIO|nr:MurR/RpiR family transcriptional regulator [Deinococcus hopiensis]SMB84725.1 transcriptional regulator, RpiR family [Deinococcus hopiensis KR-140]
MSGDTSHLPPILRRLHLLRGEVGVASGRVIEYILHDPEGFLGLTIAELSERTGTGDATVVRVVQSLGFGGFQEFKLQLSRSLAVTRQTNIGVDAGDAAVTVLSKVFDGAGMALRDTLGHLDLEAFSSAVQAVSLSRHIALIGLGWSGLIALDGQQRGLRLGLSCAAHTDPSAFLQVSSLLEPTDVLIAVSFSGASQDVVRAARLARGAGASVVAITGLGRSPLTRAAHHTLTSSAPGDRYRPEGLNVRFAQLCLLDALFTSLHASQEPYMSERIARARDARRELNADPT